MPQRHVLAAVAGFALAAAAAAQPVVALAPGTDVARPCLAWIENGDPPVVDHNVLLTAARANNGWETVALAAAGIAEDRQRPVPRRNRAVEVLVATVARAQFGSFSPAGQQQVALALGHATTDPALEPYRRGYAIAATALLVGQPQRLDWLLEGQVRLRTLLDRDHPKAWPPADEVPGMLLYFQRLGRDGLPAAASLLQVFDADALPASALAPARNVLVAMANVGDAPQAARIFASFAAQVGRRQTANELISCLHTLLRERRSLLQEPVAAAALPALCDAFLCHAQGIPDLTPAEGMWTELLLAGAQALPQLPPRLGDGLRAQCAASLLPLRSHRAANVRAFEQVWLQKAR